MSSGIWSCRDSKATRDAIRDLEDAGRVREELRLPDNRKLWCLTAAGRREAAGLLPAGAKLAALRPERDGPSTAFSEHALDVVATAGLLARADIGYLEAFSTEVEHPIRHRRSLFTDLVLRDPGPDVLVLLVEVDRENEGTTRSWRSSPPTGPGTSSPRLGVSPSPGSTVRAYSDRPTAYFHPPVI
ncbi:hypothetical protein [Kitasatospora sp. NPDC005856]|uniref:hypothetical protein n=1 Tax=Kitasatospora sp. NPDC005856 TaxID=3154566 RepID=UPI0033EEE059